MPQRIILKSAWVPMQNRSVAFARSLNEPKFFFNLGGKQEPGETPEDALVREGREEACVEIDRRTIQLLQIIEGPAHGIPDALLRMSCFSAQWEGVMKPGREIAEIEWFTSKDMHRTTKVGQKVLCMLYDRGLIR